jgi:hypothetical protein
MPCDWLKGPNGAVIHINRGRSGERKKLCPFCKRGQVAKLCDFPLGDGKTCDAEMCDHCASTRGGQHTDIGGGFTKLNDTLDYCPKHKHQTPQKEAETMKQPHITTLTDIQLGTGGGCMYNEGTEQKPSRCRKACDAGQRMCPRHVLIASYEKEQSDAQAIEDAKIERAKNVSPIGRQHRNG